MSFFFKSKKNQERNPSSRDGPPGSGNTVQSPAGRVAREEKGSRVTPTGSLNSIDEGSPISDVDRYAARRAAQQGQSQQYPVQQQHPSDLPFRNTQSPANNTSSLYPWSQRYLSFKSNVPPPFPRYGAAVNSVSSKEGDLYIMGGLINSSEVTGDLWLVEGSGRDRDRDIACNPLTTVFDRPEPRVGHAALLVGNAFIVYGGDTVGDSQEEQETPLDEALWLLNTSTRPRQWSKVEPAGPRPRGRYGHSLNIVGSKIYVFGGQVRGEFMNDLAAFDLNQLQMPNKQQVQWELDVDTAGGAPKGPVPPARTNHTMVTYNDKMYLFGGTNGYEWFNDVWCFDPMTRIWAQLDCIGYIPVPREGHAASLVDDVMYVFGGRTEEGADLGDLAAFRISSRRWYTFQNMGPSPSPRSGHTMTAVGKAIWVLGGEPSTAANAVNDLSMVYVLDTTKIRYPNDAQIQSSSQRTPHGRRPSGEQANGPARYTPSREGSNGPDPRRVPASPTGSGRPGGSVDISGPPPVSNGITKLPRVAGTATPPGPPPQGQPPTRPTVDTQSSNRRARNASIDRVEKEMGGSARQSPVMREPGREGSPITNGRRTPNQTTPRSALQNENVQAETPRSRSRQNRGQSSVDSNTEPTLKTMTSRPPSPPAPTRQPSNNVSRRGSNRNSQSVLLFKELDSARNKLDWYAAELELARKAGYTSSVAPSPALESQDTETMGTQDKALVEQLLAMKQQVSQVQSSMDHQAVMAAKNIAESDKRCEAAIREAAYYKAKLSAFNGNGADTPQMGSSGGMAEQERGTELSRQLAAAIQLQRELQTNLSHTRADLEAERKARRLADDTSDASRKRLADLEAYKQETASEVERLRAELHLAQREAREQSVASADAVAQLQSLLVEKEDLEAKYNEASGNSAEHGAALEALRLAVAKSHEIRDHLESKCDQERSHREEVEAKLIKLKADHEASTTELVAVSQRLRDAEDLAERSAAEAKAHREAVLRGLDQLATSDLNKPAHANAERLAALQEQVNIANGLVKQYQQEANAAADKLRSAEERIAGLEAYQEQSSREGVSIRRQLQSALRDTQSLQAMNSDLKTQLARQQLEANAVTVQHNTLRDILIERGISPTGNARVRELRAAASSPEASRIAELERQLEEAVASHEEAKQSIHAQVQETETAHRDRIIQLENDYQAAVHYVKGTEKMLVKLKEELGRAKNENSRLKTENLEMEERIGSNDSAAPEDWQNERAALHSKVEMLSEQMKTSAGQLEQRLNELRRELATVQQERDVQAKSHDEAIEHLVTRQRELEQIKQENGLLEKRALDAEQKVSMLLDQVNDSVNSYRRQSRMSIDQAGGAPNGAGHGRRESSDAGSVYGGLGEARNSKALDSLADELENLRNHWEETTNKHYRLSNAFDFETRKEDETGGMGMGESNWSNDWRKRLDNEERESENARTAKDSSSRS
ncbi:hypothetical protein F4780DRAFT_781658 [Xylariomycetidae sp. FL0641]|nr:hypothetical protein F4780DRAFT_781658 [Xylariomycetidae sp. FL0641]